MLKKIKRLNGETIQILASFANINIEDLLEGKTPDLNNLKYKSLLLDTQDPVNDKVEFDVEKVIDQLMFDNYGVYMKMKERLADIDVDDAGEHI